MKANERGWALLVVGVCSAGVILAVLGRFVYEICVRWPFFCPWLEWIGFGLLFLVAVKVGLCVFLRLGVLVRSRRITRRRLGPARSAYGVEDGFIRFRVKL